MFRKRAPVLCLLALLMLFGCRPSAEAPSSSGAPLSTLPLEESGNPVLQLIGRSRAAGDFAEGDIPAEDIELILSAGAKAQSAKNAQPWHFSVILRDGLSAELLEAAQPGNVLVVISGNPDIVTDTLAFDCGMAAQNMQLAAEALGYGARVYIQPVSEIQKSWREELRIPKGYIVQAAILIGRAGEAPDAQSSATARRSLDDTVSWIT